MGTVDDEIERELEDKMRLVEITVALPNYLHRWLSQHPAWGRETPQQAIVRYVRQAHRRWKYKNDKEVADNA